MGRAEKGWQRGGTEKGNRSSGTSQGRDQSHRGGQQGLKPRPYSPPLRFRGQPCVAKPWPICAFAVSAVTPLPGLGLAASVSLQHWVLETRAPGSRHTEAPDTGKPLSQPRPYQQHPLSSSRKPAPWTRSPAFWPSEPRPGQASTQSKGADTTRGRAWLGPRS